MHNREVHSEHGIHRLPMHPLLGFWHTTDYLVMYDVLADADGCGIWLIGRPRLRAFLTFRGRVEAFVGLSLRTHSHIHGTAVRHIQWAGVNDDWVMLGRGVYGPRHLTYISDTSTFTLKIPGWLATLQNQATGVHMFCSFISLSGCSEMYIPSAMPMQ